MDLTYRYRDDRMPAMTALKVTVSAAGHLLHVDLSAGSGSGSSERSGGCG